MAWFCLLSGKLTTATMRLFDSDGATGTRFCTTDSSTSRHQLPIHFHTLRDREATLRRARCEALMETIIDSANYLFDVDNMASQRLQ
jgi:hypothetical protein